MWNCKNWYIRDFIIKRQTRSMFFREKPEIMEDRNEEFAGKGSTIVDFIRIFILSCGSFKETNVKTHRRRISHNATNLADFVRSSVPSRTIVIRSRKNRNCPYKIFQSELPSFFWNNTYTYILYVLQRIRAYLDHARYRMSKQNSFKSVHHLVSQTEKWSS